MQLEKNSDVRSRAVKALGNIGKQAQEAILILVQITENPNEDINVIKESVEAIRKISPSQYAMLPLEFQGLRVYSVHFLCVSQCPSSLRYTLTTYKRNNPILICQTFIRNILSWKCPEPSTANTTNSPQPQNTNSRQNNPPASTSQPTKK